MVHVVRLRTVGKEPTEHLSVEDVRTILKKAKPRLTLLTHFGMTMTKAKPRRVAAEFKKELRLKVVAASDGTKINLEEV